MSKIVLDVSVSLDGFTTGPNVGPEAPMGEGGERLHDWMFDDGPDRTLRTEGDAIGANLVGRRTFDLGLEPWGGTPWPGVPAFVVTHRTRADLLGDNGGTFAFDGLEAAARRAKESAGDKDVLVLGANVAGQLLEAGLLDEVRIHLVPLVLGEGTPLFAGVQAELTPAAEPVGWSVAHLRYRVSKP